MSFDVQFLGTGASLPTGKRNPSAQYIECNERHILIDCGEGTQNQLRKFKIKFQKIKIILISHLHGDHYFGLMGLLSTMSLLGRNKDIMLFAPEQLEEIIDIQLKASGHKYDFSIHFYKLNFNTKTLIFEDKSIEIYAFPLNHRIETYGFIIKEKEKEYRLNGELLKMNKISLSAIPFFRKGKDFIDEDGKVFKANDFTFKPIASKSYAYCSDNLVLDSQIEFVYGVDFLYHEATFTNEHIERAFKTKHSTSKQAAAFAKKCRVKKLILGHISSRYDSVEMILNEAKSEFNDSIVAEDGMKLNIK